jgi:hypothetical protein
LLDGRRDTVGDSPFRAMSDAQKCARFEYNERTVAVTEARCEILDLLSQGLDAKVVPEHCCIRF